jgi:hypothetical protein
MGGGLNSAQQYFTFADSGSTGCVNGYTSRTNKMTSSASSNGGHVYGGPIITSLSPASSHTNVMYASQSGFEPFIKKTSTSSSSSAQTGGSSGYVSRTESTTRNCSSRNAHACDSGNGVYTTIQKHSSMSLPTAAGSTVITAHGTVSGGGRRGGREEEEEELVDVVSNSPVEMDRQFRPIFKPVNDSGNSTPIAVNHGRNSGPQQQAINNNSNNNRRVNNHSSSSYGNGNDEFVNCGNRSNGGWAGNNNNNHYQPYYSSQTIAN